jgi:hypothetical protein
MTQRVAATETTRERLRALIDGRLGTGAERSDLVRLAARLILEEALEAEVRAALGRERYERGAGAPAGYRDGYRTGRMRTAEGMVMFSAPQVRAPRPSRSPRRSGRTSPAARKPWRISPSSCSRAGCRRGTSRTRSPTTPAGAW